MTAITQGPLWKARVRRVHSSRGAVVASFPTGRHGRRQTRLPGGAHPRCGDRALAGEYGDSDPVRQAAYSNPVLFAEFFRDGKRWGVSKEDLAQWAGTRGTVRVTNTWGAGHGASCSTSPDTARTPRPPTPDRAARLASAPGAKIATQRTGAEWCGPWPGSRVNEIGEIPPETTGRCSCRSFSDIGPQFEVPRDDGRLAGLGGIGGVPHPRMQLPDIGRAGSQRFGHLHQARPCRRRGTSPRMPGRRTRAAALRAGSHRGRGCSRRCAPLGRRELP